MDSRRLCILACLGLAIQLAAASEDWDWGNPATASWAIARENDVVLDMHREAEEEVETAVRDASKHIQDLVDAHIAGWQAPVQCAVEKATALGVNVTECSYDINHLNDQIDEVKAAQPLCVVAGRARWDMEVAKLKDVAANMLQLLVKAQDQSKDCEGKSSQLLQALCRLFRVTATVLKAQDDRLRKAVTPYWQIINEAPSSIASETVACIDGAFDRSNVGAANNIKIALSCIDDLVQEQRGGTA